jgi:hypothetical protein
MDYLTSVKIGGQFRAVYIGDFDFHRPMDLVDNKDKEIRILNPHNFP